MVNYTKALIYKIQHNENKSLCYIGSTVDFRTRKCNHKRACYNENGLAYNYKVYQMIRNNGGWECFTMIPIEEYPCASKIQLHIREEQVRVEYNANMNMVKAHLTVEEKQEYQKQYRVDNIDKIKTDSKQYRIDNADKTKEYQNQYRIDNADKISENKKQKVTCECGCIVTNDNLSRHRKSKKHHDLISP